MNRNPLRIGKQSDCNATPSWVLITAACLVLSLMLPGRALAAELEPGNHTHKIKVGDRKRRYIVHVPKGYSGQVAPAVIVLHGGGGNTWTARRNSRMSEQADKDCFLAVYPEGSGRFRRIFLTWNGGQCCGSARKKNVDDIGFLRAMICQLKNDYKVDPERVYITGISNGGMLAYRAACELSDCVAAIAPVSSCMLTKCQPTSPVSIVTFNGNQDNAIRSSGGVGAELGYKISCPPLKDTVAFWVRHNECSPAAILEERNSVLIQRYSGGKNGTEVCVYTYPGGHAWPGGRRSTPTADRPPKLLNATMLMCDFFWKHPKPSSSSVAAVTEKGQ